MSRVNIGHTLQAPNAHHAGLWFDRYLKKHAVKGQSSTGKDEDEPRQKHVKETASIAMPAIYKHFFDQWKESLAAFDGDGYQVQTKVATTLGRLSVGLGNEGVIETSITLHHTYGVPYIPGSALKGLAANYAHRALGGDWAKGTNAHDILFGFSRENPKEEGASNADAGYVNFFDALYVPGSGKDSKPLYPDVITVHHPEYYNQNAPSAPADWDNPTPIPCLTANGKFLLALAGPANWVDAAYKILAHALIEWGVGAKTSSGYGRMTIEGFESLKPTFNTSTSKAQTSTSQTAVQTTSSAITKVVVTDDPIEQLIARIERLATKDVAGQINSHVESWKRLPEGSPGKKRVAVAIVKKVREAGRESTSREKAWYQELLRASE